MAPMPQAQLHTATYELPPEAGDINAPRFEPEDAWLRSAPPELQIRAMRRWFDARYVDPVHTTPHDEKGEYLFVGDGPFEPQSVLDARFGGVVGDAAIAELAQTLRREVGDQWARRADDPGISS